MTQAVTYARFSPQPMVCPNCQTRMSRMTGLDVFDCSTCEHVAELGDGDQGSIKAQLDLCRKYCHQKGYTVTDEFHDEALSGASLERPGLDAAIDALRRGDVLVIHMLDRLSRGDGEDWTDIERRIRAKGARYESASDEGTWNNDEDADLLRDILRVLNNYNRKKGNRRTRELMTAYQNAGRRMTPKNKVPFGMMVDPADPSKLVKSPAEQTTIEAIIATHGKVLLGEHRGKGYRETARRLKELGVKARNDGPVTHTLVRSILKRGGAFE